MKKIISIFFIVIYLFSFTIAKEIIKLPAFISHYKEHNAANKEITLVDFILLHYLNGSEKDKDYQEDMKLPFKTQDNISCLMNIVLDLPKTFILEIDKNLCINLHLDNIFYPSKDYILNNYHSIFQPPELV